MKECIYVAKESQQRTLKHCIDMIVDVEAKYPIEVVRIAKVKTPHVAFTNESITSVSGICSSQKTKLMPGEFETASKNSRMRKQSGVLLITSSLFTLH